MAGCVTIRDASCGFSRVHIQGRREEMGTATIVIVSAVILSALVVVGAFRWLLHRHYRDVPRATERIDDAGRSRLDI